MTAAALRIQVRTGNLNMEGPSVMVTLLGRMSSHHGGAFRSTQSVNSLADHSGPNETIPATAFEFTCYSIKP